METFVVLATLAAVHLAAVISPGPSLIVVARTSVAVAPSAGLLAALGMGLGSLVWALAALFGLTLLFEIAPWLYAAMKVAGAVFLLFLALTMWRQASRPFAVALGDNGRSPAASSSFGTGLLTQLSNPKVVVFFGSVFVTLLPSEPPLAMLLGVLAIVFLNEFGWFALVAYLFSRERPRTLYLRGKAWIDRIFGTFLGGLGLSLLLDRRAA